MNTDNSCKSNPQELSQPKLRVLLVSHAYVVGVNQGKLKAIADTEEIEIALLAPNNWKALEWNRLLKLETPFDNYPTYSASVWFSGKVGAHFYSPLAIWRVVQDFQPDLIHVEEEVFSLCALEIAIFAKVLKIPISVFGWENQQRSLPYLRKLLGDFVMEVAKLYIAGNQDGATVMRNWNYRGKIEVMPQIGVDTNLFTPSAKTIINNNSELTIGFLGRLKPQKGLDILFTAISQIKQQNLNCRLIICGSGSAEAELRQKAQQQGIADWITWRGAIPHSEAPQAIREFDVLVLPSRTIDTWKEQFGHVIIEAMAMGIPVVGSSCGEIPHVIDCEELIFPEEDFMALAAILIRGINNRSWLRAMGESGLRRVNKYYSHERIARRLIALWQEEAVHKLLELTP